MDKVIRSDGSKQHIHTGKYILTGGDRVINLFLFQRMSPVNVQLNQIKLN